MKFERNQPQCSSTQIARITEVNEYQNEDRHIHHRGWIVYWRTSYNSSRYDLWIDDDKGDRCFTYDDCLDLAVAIELATRAINAVIDGDSITRNKYFEPSSSFYNSLTRQIWRSDEKLDPIIDRANHGY